MTTLSDDFNRADNASLGANWTEVIDGAEIVSNDVVLTGASSLNTHNTTLAGVDQYAKISWSGGAGGDIHIPWLVFRYSTAFYSVRFNIDADTVSWYSHTSSADAAGTLIGSTAATIAQAENWGATIEGVGNATVVRAWKTPTGNVPDSAALWGGAAPTITLTNDPGTAVNTGSKVGFGHTTANPFAQHVDNWFGGDVPAAGAPATPTYERRLDLVQQSEWGRDLSFMKVNDWFAPELTVEHWFHEWLQPAAGGGGGFKVAWARNANFVHQPGRA